MLIEEQSANAYEEATDGCRSVLGLRDSARQWQRVKPNDESHVLAELDCEKEPRWVSRYRRLGVDEAESNRAFQKTQYC
jgi:hypothetical protein